MPIYLNSAKIGSTAYNVHNSVSTKLNKIKLNTTQVWTGIPEIYNTVKNATGNVTEAQWLEFLNEGCVALARQLGETSSFRGKNVTLSNTVVSNYTSWKIADFNHDNSGNTVDLIQNNTIKASQFSNSNNIYSSSSARSYLINTYLPGFSTDIKNKLQTMPIPTYSGDTTDKIKLLSGTEVGGSDLYMSTTEGTKYPIFTSSSGTSADSSRVRSGANNYWWLRSRNTSGNTYAQMWIVSYNGALALNDYTGSLGVVPCIRFS